MTTALDRTLLDEVSGLIAERMGLHFPEERWPDLARGLRSAGLELGFGHPEACVEWLRGRSLTSRQIETLASHLTVGETYFFRDPASFEALEREVLPPLLARRAETGKTLRLWSAGCCTGEEAYSLAITCARALPDRRGWSVSILATDINPSFLAKAEAGVYTSWSFRGAPDWLRARFFTAAPDRKHAIDPAIQELVHFAYLNLAEDAYPSLHNHTNAMDVIFCRNVIMYFTPEHQRRVVAALHRALVDGGCLVVNPAEASVALFPMFALENLDGVLLFRKSSRPAGEGPPPEPLAVRAPAVSPPEPLASRTPAVSPPEPLASRAPAAAVTPVAQPNTASPPESPLELARIHADQGRLEQALASCEDAIAAERTNLAAHFLVATICVELGRVEAAIAALGKVLYLDQDFVLAHQALGGLYKRLGKEREAARHLTVALDLLSKRGRDELVPESGGMTCGRLLESVRAMREA